MFSNIAWTAPDTSPFRSFRQCYRFARAGVAELNDVSGKAGHETYSLESGKGTEFQIKVFRRKDADAVKNRSGYCVLTCSGCGGAEESAGPSELFEKLGHNVNENVSCVVNVVYSQADCRESSVAEVKTAVEWITQHENLRKQKIILVGWSMGGAVAVQVAEESNEDDISGLILLASQSRGTEERLENVVGQAAVKRDTKIAILQGSMDRAIAPKVAQDLYTRSLKSFEEIMKSSSENSAEATDEAGASPGGNDNDRGAADNHDAIKHRFENVPLWYREFPGDGHHLESAYDYLVSELLPGWQEGVSGDSKLWEQDEDSDDE